MLKLKNSNLYKQDIYFKENFIEIKYKKELKQQINYSEILQFDIYADVDKHNAPNSGLITLFFDYPDVYSVNVVIKIKTEEIDEYIFTFNCPLKQIFGIINYKDKFKNFNFYLNENKKIKSFTKIPLIFYALCGVKFNILGKPFSKLELNSFFLLLIPSIIMFLPAYLYNTLDNVTGFMILLFYVISALLSIIGIRNEIKKLNMKNKFVPDMIMQNIEKANDVGEKCNLIIDNNKVIFSEDCYQFINKFRYISILLFVLNFIMIFCILILSGIL